MPEYRVYIIDENDQVAAEPLTLNCADDHVAVTKASKLANGNTIEVWSSSRRVAYIPAFHALLRGMRHHSKQVYLKRAAECLELRASAPKSLWPALVDLSNNWREMAAPSLTRKVWKLFKPN